MKKRNQIPHPDDLQQEDLPQKTDRLGIDRRKFFKLFGGGLAVAFVMQDVLLLGQEAGAPGSSVLPANQVGAWIHIGEDGKVNVYTGKVEVGQNIRTSLSQIVAE